MVAGLVLALTIMVTWPGLPRFGTHYLCDPTGDAYLGLWSMWHWNRAVESLQSPYWTDMLFHPTGMSLLYNCYSVVDMLLIAIPLTRIAGMTIAYNTMVAFGYVATGAATYVLVRHLTASSFPAACAAVFFAFCPFRFANSNCNYQLATTQWIALYALFLIRVVKRHRIRDALFAGLFLGVVGLSCRYFFVYCALLTVAVLAHRLLTTRQVKRELRGLATTLPALGATAALLIGWWIVPMIVRAPEFEMSRHQPQFWGADLAQLVVPPPRSLLGHRLSSISERFPPYQQPGNYVGLVPLVVCLVAIRKIRAARFWGLCMTGALLLSLGPYPMFMSSRLKLPLPQAWITYTVPGHIQDLALFVLLAVFALISVHRRWWRTRVFWGVCVALALGFAMVRGTRVTPGGLVLPLPHRLLEMVPGLKWHGMPCRFMVMVHLCMAIMLGYAFRSIGKRWQYAIIVVGVLELLLCVRPWPFPSMKSGFPKTYDAIHREQGNFAIIDMPNDCGNLYCQIAHGKRLVGGSASRFELRATRFLEANPTLLFLVRDNEDSPPKPDLKVLKDQNIRYIVVRHADTERMQAKMRIIEGWGLQAAHREAGLVTYRCW